MPRGGSTSTPTCCPALRRPRRSGCSDWACSSGGGCWTSCVSSSESGQRVDRRQAVVYSLLAALSALVAGAGIWWAVSAAARGKLTVGDVSIFIAALGAAAAALSAIVSNAATWLPGCADASVPTPTS